MTGNKTTLYLSSADMARFERVKALRRDRKRKEPFSLSGFARSGISHSVISEYLDVTVSEGAMVALSKGMFDALQRVVLENGHVMVILKEDCYQGSLHDEVGALKAFAGDGEVSG